MGSSGRDQLCPVSSDRHIVFVDPIYLACMDGDQYLEPVIDYAS
jgi:hypothetical protein